MEDKIIEGNRLIAEFMEAIKQAHISDSLFWFDNPPTIFSSHQWDDFAMKYHSSWDWLMPVVEKIENINNTEVDIKGNLCLISFIEDGHWTGRVLKGMGGKEKPSNEFKIEAAWEAVVEFIKWYNTQNK